jgi:uncharacterized paraquat-inducible protein A
MVTPMAEYREQVKHLREWTVLDIQNHPAHTIRMMQAAADTIEKLDAVPVVHGRWIHRKYDASDDSDEYYYCSKCHEIALSEFGRYTYVRSDYCPNCGADMRERKDGDTDG